MKDKVIKKLEELKKQKVLHEKHLQELTSAQQKCVATINGTIGAIEAIESLLKEDPKKEPDKK